MEYYGHEMGSFRYLVLISLSFHQGELALKIAGEIGQRSDEAYTLIHMAKLLGPRGEYARALEVAQCGLDVAQDIEHRQWMTAGHRVLGALYLDLLALSEAQQHLEQALALAQEIGSWFWIRTTSSLFASVCIGLNELAQAEALLTAAPASDAPPQTLAQRLIWFARAQLALAQGEPYRTLAITGSCSRPLRMLPVSKAFLTWRICVG